MSGTEVAYAWQLFLIDGFPRNLDNFQGWEAVVGESVDIKFVLYFDCDQVRGRNTGEETQTENETKRKRNEERQG